MKKMLDLFSGPDRRRVDAPGGVHSAFADAGWDVTTVDLNQRDGWDFKPDIESNILELTPEDLPHETYDVVWASPPCPRFSVAALYHHWTEDNLPKTPEAADAVHIVYRTLWIIQAVKPTYWWMENPRGKLRTILPIDPAGTVAYCQYGDDVMKPTDLWGEHPASFDYKMCENGASCHEAAVRGADNGTQNQNRDPVKRSYVPRGLADAILESVQNPGKSIKQSTVEAVI